MAKKTLKKMAIPTATIASIAGIIAPLTSMTACGQNKALVVQDFDMIYGLISKNIYQNASQT